MKSSQFFKSTLDAPSKKTPSKEIKLDNTAQSFEIYLKWLHSGYFYIVEEKDDHGTDNAYMKWEECYGLGHELQDWSFKDACIDLAQETVISGNRHFNDLSYPIYTTSPAPQAHKTFAIHLAAHLWWDSDFRRIPDTESPVEWLVDLIAYMGPKMRHSELTEIEKAEEFFKNVGCKYHAHGPNTPCYKKTNIPYEEVKDCMPLLPALSKKLTDT